MTSPPSDSPQAVLDTNVVLDWLLFCNPDCAALGAAIGSGSVRWIATASMREEFAFVLGDGRFAKWRPDLPALLGAWDRHCTVVPEPVTAPSTAATIRCTDPDDQMFVDLAAASPARWLVSRDRAVLKLGRRLRAFVVDVIPPGRWQLTLPCSSAPPDRRDAAAP